MELSALRTDDDRAKIASERFRYVEPFHPECRTWNVWEFGQFRLWEWEEGYNINRVDDKLRITAQLCGVKDKAVDLDTAINWMKKQLSETQS